MKLSEMEYEIETRKERMKNFPDLTRPWDMEQLQDLEEEYQRRLGEKFSMIDVDSIRDSAYEQAVALDAKYREWLAQTENTRTEKEQEEAEFCLSPLSVMKSLTAPQELSPQYSGKAGHWAQEAADFLDGNYPRVYMMMKYRADRDFPWLSLLERSVRDLENSIDGYSQSLTTAGMEQRGAVFTAWDEIVGEVTKKDEYVDPDMDIERGDEEWLPAWVMETLNQIV